MSTSARTWVTAAAWAAIVGGWLAVCPAHAQREPSEALGPEQSRPAQMYLLTDRPLYRPGDRVHFRAWELAGTLESVRSAHNVTVELLDPQGSVAATAEVPARDGVIAGEIALGESFAGGRYTLRATSDLGPVETRDVVVGNYELGRLPPNIAFGRSSYAAGERVSAEVTLRDERNRPARGAAITAVVWLDGVELHSATVRSDRRGRAVVRFRLPAIIPRGDCLMTLSMRHGGLTESAQRRVPVVADRVDLAIFPEGGDLVTGLPSRVYVAAHTPLGAPLDLRAEVIDDRNQRVAEVRTSLRGMGRFRFTPEAGRTYRLRVQGPMATEIAFPTVRPNGCVLSADASGTHGLRTEVRCTDAQTVNLRTTIRGRELARHMLSAGPRRAVARRLTLDRGQEGVVAITLSDERGPIAERLVYVALGRGLEVSVASNQDQFAPGDEVELVVRTRDGRGEPVAADIALAVVDEALISLASDRTGHILSQLYLEPEMPGQQIADPNFYFSDDPDAAQGMDLLLGTRGWRRFRR
ncbi:MAG: MG2 domain-containing protein [Myxococcota bacterium]